MGLLKAALAFCLIATAAQAQVLDQNTARKMLFSTRGHTIQVSGGLSETDAKTIRALIPFMAEQMRQPVKYFTSIAWSPDDGLVSDALQGAVNFHSTEASDSAAIAACNKARSAGARGCELAARVVPKGYKPQFLTLSSDATEGFNRAYRRARSPKALAISRATGAWGIGAGDASAIASCAGDARGAGDCTVVIRD